MPSSFLFCPLDLSAVDQGVDSIMEIDASGQPLLQTVINLLPFTIERCKDEVTELVLNFMHNLCSRCHTTVLMVEHGVTQHLLRALGTKHAVQMHEVSDTADVESRTNRSRIPVHSLHPESHGFLWSSLATKRGSGKGEKKNLKSRESERIDLLKEERKRQHGCCNYSSIASLTYFPIAVSF